ncbi:inner membrane CreD family protein [Utexia brackfieldae]|uniref:inner membrane CreD family protein n=1 Tax=Utexia brackfieldae TaxID=3074108 RepID=UPI00370D0B39
MENKVILLAKLIMVLLMLLLLQLPISFIKNYTQNNLIHDSLTITLFSPEHKTAQSRTIIDTRPAEKLAYYQSSFTMIDNASVFIGLSLGFLLLLDLIKGYNLVFSKYLLIGAGLVVFYLLLLSLSTLSLSFKVAYFSCVTIALLIFLLYLFHSLNTLSLGLIYTLSLLVLYSFAYYFMLVQHVYITFVISGLVFLLLIVVCLVLSQKSKPKKVILTAVDKIG